MTFAPDYVDVAERRREFFGLYPKASLQGEGEFVRDEQGRILGYLYRAFAYRSPEDERPGIGTAYEQIPGATPYTRNSEVMNAETSAWGRAILAACGIDSKKIASADEVRARQDAGEGVDSSVGNTSPANPAEKARLAAEAAKAARTPEDDGQPENVVVTFGKHKGQRLGELPSAYLSWLVGNFEAKNAEQRRILAAAQVLVGAAQVPLVDEDVPF